MMYGVFSNFEKSHPKIGRNAGSEVYRIRVFFFLRNKVWVKILKQNNKLFIIFPLYLLGTNLETLERLISRLFSDSYELANFVLK